MTFNNTTLAIVGIIIIGILSTYMGNKNMMIYCVRLKD